LQGRSTIEVSAPPMVFVVNNESRKMPPFSFWYASWLLPDHSKILRAQRKFRLYSANALHAQLLYASHVTCSQYIAPKRTVLDPVKLCEHARGKEEMQK
jgi:hypothetical protein